jgi:hypothetical protein
MANFFNHAGASAGCMFLSLADIDGMIGINKKYNTQK